MRALTLLALLLLSACVGAVPGRSPAPAVAGGTPVYSASECIGPVIMGQCHGSILPQAGYHQTCHGAWLNGQCTGPMF